MRLRRRSFLGSLAAVPFLRLETVLAVHPTANAAPVYGDALHWSHWVTLPDGGAVGYWLADLGGQRALINPVVIEPAYMHGDARAIRDALKEDARKETLTMVEKSHARRKRVEHADVSGQSRKR